jgi:hypothetical protein
VCEAFPPGAEPRPPAPLALDALAQASAPAPPSARAPDGAAARPGAHCPLAHACPPIRRHAVPVCALTGIFGGVPTEPMPLLAKQKPRAPAAAPSAAAAPAPAPKAWTLQESVFAPRPKEVDGRDFWDSKRVFGAACNCDYARLCKEQRYWKFIERNDDDARSAEAVQVGERERTFAPLSRNVPSL